MSDYLKNLEKIRTNPLLMIDYALDTLSQQLEGKGDFDIPDNTHPFAWAIENSIMVGALAMAEGESLMRRLYPQNAIRVEDLYLHMSDVDYPNRFANPAITHYEFYFNKEELLSLLVPEGTSGTKKIRIPRLTTIKTDDYHFTMQYPIDIRQLRHGGLQTTYDLSDKSPLQTLDSNVVEMVEMNFNRVDYVCLRVPIYQMKVENYIESLNPSLPFEATYTFEDQFYHVRAYLSDNSGNWNEIATTHSAQVFDPNNPTLVLNVLNGKLHAEFPLIYSTLGRLTGELRIDLYTTKGVIDVDLGSRERSQFEVNFNMIDDDPTYVNPLLRFSDYAVMSPNRVMGGSDAVDFETLRTMVINNVSGSNNIPITGVQVESFLERRGYTLVSNVDTITNRQFLASRQLPAPVNLTSTSPAGTLMGQVLVTLEQLATSKHVADNGNRVTLLPSMLYNLNNGVVELVDDDRIDWLNSLSAEAKARIVMESRYLYTPFHYVLDVSAANFDVRPYYLDNPSIIRKTFIGSNDSSQLQVSLDTYTIERIANGYRLKVKLKSDDRFKQIPDDVVVVQMGYKPVGENNYASINGTLIGITDDERVYQFDILTNYDIDVGDNLLTTNLSMFDETQTNFATGLENDFEFTVILNQAPSLGYLANELDGLVQTHLLNVEFMTVVRESLRLRLGYPLKDLWRRNRSVIGEEDYQRHEVDVPALYTETIYERDQYGAIIITNDPVDGLKYSILHRAGDPILDDLGNPVMKYRVGDPVLDLEGNPILKEGRKIRREFTLFLVDGLYYFATEETTVAYRNEIPMQIVNWLQTDIAAIRKPLLENCELYLCPITTYGSTVATVKDGLLTTIDLDQAISITYYMDANSYTKTSIRPALISSAKSVVSNQLSRTRVVKSDIVTALKTAAGEDVSGIEVSGIGGTADYSILTLEDKAVRLSLRKKLVVLSNQELAIEDDITINFLRH